MSLLISLHYTNSFAQLQVTTGNDDDHKRRTYTESLRDRMMDTYIGRNALYIRRENVI